MQNKGKLTIMKYFRACVGSFLVDSKFTNQITNVKKNKVWREVQMKVNALGVASRSVPEVKNKWNNMIQKAKKENTEFVTKARATGGGPPPTPLSPISSRIVDIYGDSPAFSGLMGVQSSFAGLFSL